MFELSIAVNTRVLHYDEDGEITAIEPGELASVGTYSEVFAVMEKAKSWAFDHDILVIQIKRLV